MLPDGALIKSAWLCKCPRCGKGNLFQKGLTVELQQSCSECGLDFTKNDSADGPAVFLIFVLGFLLVPLALLIETLLSPALWVHAILWTFVALTLILGTLKPLKSYIILLQYKHRPEGWE